MNLSLKLSDYIPTLTSLSVSISYLRSQFKLLAENFLLLQESTSGVGLYINDLKKLQKDHSLFQTDINKKLESLKDNFEYSVKENSFRSKNIQVILFFLYY
jgi:hypothetical protein